MLQFQPLAAPRHVQRGGQLSFRIAGLVGQPPLIDATFRLFSARVIPHAARRRFLFAGLEADEIDGTLRTIRSLTDWPVAWETTARRREARARQAERHPGATSATTHWRAAALAYGFAGATISTAPGGSPARDSDLEAARLAAFRRAAPGLTPPATPVTIPWRGRLLPGWLRQPDNGAAPVPLVVIFNGAGIVKEETTLWSDAFLARGFATLAFDGPGCGELRGRLAADNHQEDITAAILDWTSIHPALDATRVALLGVSFGGAQVIHHAAANPEVAACIAVTPPFHPPPYVDRVHPFVLAEIAALCGNSPAEIIARAGDLSCRPTAGAVRCPTLVVGAGVDTILPPAEARRLYDALDCPKAFLYLPRATHIGMSHLDLWTNAAADWLATHLATPQHLAA